MENQTTVSEDKREDRTLSLFKESMQNILNAFPLPTALLDQYDKVVTVNINFLKLFVFPNGDHLLGKKPNEIFNCSYAIDTVRNNQVADRCQTCGTNLSTDGNKVICEKFTEKCNLAYVNENGELDKEHNLKVTTSPFTFNGEQFYLFSITDISNDVRRRLLERIFFHDVLNLAGNIIGIMDVINLVGKDDKESAELFELLRSTSQDLFNEIKYQRDLSAAENNELKPIFKPTSSLGILHSTKNDIVNSYVAVNREVLITSSSSDHELLTDGVLLRRVLLNMLKNALEATETGGKVVMGCEPIDQDSVRFWVHNDTSIPNDIQIQIFNQTTSTKGNNRGLGTSSMRLVGEKYLKGKVNFTSSEDAGTHFMIDLPLQHGKEAIM